MKTLLLVALVTVGAITFASPQTRVDPRPISSEEWTAILMTAIGSQKGAPRDLSSAVRDVALSLARKASGTDKQSPATSRLPENTFRLSPEARGASQGNSAMNQWARLGGVKETSDSREQAQDATESSQLSLVSTLLFWYSSEVRTTFKNAKEKEQWQIERIALAQICRTARQHFGVVVDQSWLNFMSACHVLGYPQATLPEDSTPGSASRGLAATSSYPASSGHWVKKNIDRGRIIQLEDGSLWSVSSIDVVNTMLWLPTETIIVVESANPKFPFKLVNSDSRSAAEARFLSNRAGGEAPLTALLRLSR